MSSLVRSGMVVEFCPTADWRWVEFDGRVRVSAGHHRLDHEGDAGVVDEDLTRLAAELVGRRYVARGFDDEDGAVLEAAVEIDRATLFHRTVIEGRVAAKSDTTGTFRVTCRPSLKSGAPPVPDGQPAHEGTWAILPPAHARTEC